MLKEHHAITIIIKRNPIIFAMSPRPFLLPSIFCTVFRYRFSLRSTMYQCSFVEKKNAAPQSLGLGGSNMRCNSFSVFATTAFSAGKRNVLFFPAVFRCRVERSIYEKKIFLHQKWCRPFFAFDATAFLPKNGYCFLFCFWQSLPDCQIKRGKVYEKEIFIAPEMVQSAFCLCGYGLFCRKAAVLPFFFCYPAELRESCRAREYIIREIIILHSTPFRVQSAFCI